MRLRAVVFVIALLGVPAAVHAQDFGVMESAETIDRGNFKFKANPMLLFGRNGGDADAGLALIVGYGVTPRFDVEGGIALYDGVQFFGGTAEYWLVKDRALDLSITGGLHVRRGDLTPDMTGVDLTVLASKHVSPRLELYGALDMAFESISGGGDFRTVHVVPGLEFRLGPDLDFVAEVGIAANDNGRHYFSGGIAYYFR